MKKRLKIQLLREMEGQGMSDAWGIGFLALMFFGFGICWSVGAYQIGDVAAFIISAVCFCGALLLGFTAYISLDGSRQATRELSSLS